MGGQPPQLSGKAQRYPGQNGKSHKKTLAVEMKNPKPLSSERSERSAKRTLLTSEHEGASRRFPVARSTRGPRVLAPHKLRLLRDAHLPHHARQEPATDSC